MADDISTCAAMMLAKKDTIEFAIANHAMRYVGILHPPHTLESISIFAECAADEDLFSVHYSVFLPGVDCVCEVMFISVEGDPPGSTYHTIAQHIAAQDTTDRG